MEIIICRNNKERKDLSQALKIGKVEWLIVHSIENGESKIKTFSIIYLKEKLIIRVKDEM